MNKKSDELKELMKSLDLQETDREIQRVKGMGDFAASIDNPLALVLKSAQKLNSAFPETQHFLKTLGKSCVSELDEREKRLLAKYLERKMKEALSEQENK